MRAYHALVPLIPGSSALPALRSEDMRAAAFAFQYGSTAAHDMYRTVRAASIGAVVASADLWASAVSAMGIGGILYTSSPEEMRNYATAFAAGAAMKLGTYALFRTKEFFERHALESLVQSLPDKIER